jgi:hypothetical protein
LNSPWLDLTHSTPSIHLNARYDYIRPPTKDGIPSSPPIPDSVWPTSPPRADIYCPAAQLNHPLVSPAVASPDLWLRPPSYSPARTKVWMTAGTELLTDSITATATKMHQAGTPTTFVGYDALPHCAAMVFPTSREGQDCFRRWADFCIAVTADPSLPPPRQNTVKTAPSTEHVTKRTDHVPVEGAPDTNVSSAIWITARSNPLKPQPVPMHQLCAIPDGGAARVATLIHQARDAAVRRESALLEAWIAETDAKHREGKLEEEGRETSPVRARL